MKPVNQSKALFRGAFVLTLAALVSKVLSAFYRIPYQNIVGDVGFYIYQQVYPFYGIAVALSTTGFPVVISKLFAEQRATGNKVKNQVLLVLTYLYLQLFGFLCFLVLYFGSGFIARWMNDPNLSILLRVVSVVFLIFPVGSVLRGYYQGKGDMVPTALSQVGEQTIRVLTIILTAYIFTKKGYSLYLTGGGAMFGSLTGSIVSAVILFIFIWIRKEWKLRDPGLSLEEYIPAAKLVFKTLVIQGLAICISGMLLVFIQMADSLNLYSLLVEKGTGEAAAKSLKGIFDRGQPLIQLGTVAATSMSLSLVPLISSERFKGNSGFLKKRIITALKISAVIGVGASVGLWAIIRQTNTMLFENAFGSSVLGVLGFVILFSSMISTITAIMQGLGQTIFPAIAVIASFPVKYILNMVFVPLWGTMGAAVSTIITLAAISLLFVFRFKRMTRVRLSPSRFILALGSAALFMALLVKAYLLFSGAVLGTVAATRIGTSFQALTAALLGGFIFLFIIIRFRVFSVEELSIFPFGSKLMHFLPKKERN